MRNRTRLNPFPSAPYKKQETQGGARAGVQAASEALDAGGMLISRIYAPPSIVNFDQSDPRYAGKSDVVENVYQPAQDPKAPRSGFQQMVNWLLKGELA